MNEDREWKVTNIPSDHAPEVVYGVVHANSASDAVDIIHARQTLMNDAGWPKSCLKATEITLPKKATKANLA